MYITGRSFKRYSPLRDGGDELPYADLQDASQDKRLRLRPVRRLP